MWLTAGSNDSSFPRSLNWIRKKTTQNTDKSVSKSTQGRLYTGITSPWRHHHVTCLREIVRKSSFRIRSSPNSPHKRSNTILWLVETGPNRSSDRRDFKKIRIKYSIRDSPTKYSSFMRPDDESWEKSVFFRVVTWNSFWNQRTCKWLTCGCRSNLICYLYSIFLYVYFYVKLIIVFYFYLFSHCRLKL